MIVSIHIPKTAGQSFRLRLEAVFGEQLLKDYGDWIGLDRPEAQERNARRATEMRERRDEIERDYDVISGQFVADKYCGLFRRTDFVAFVRDPCQQAISHYNFLLRHPEIRHPWVQEFHRTRPSLPEMIAAVPNVQSLYFGKLSVEDMSMIGLTEAYDRSTALFEAVTGCRLHPETTRGNVNPDRAGDAYPVAPDVRKAIETHRAADLELYRKAREAFARLALQYDL